MVPTALAARKLQGQKFLGGAALGRCGGEADAAVLDLGGWERFRASGIQGF